MTKNKITQFDSIEYIEFGYRKEEDEKTSILYVHTLNEDIMGVSYKCPCGNCVFSESHSVYIPISDLEEVNLWVASIRDSKLTLSPSVKMRGECESHYFIKDNKIEWV